MTKPVLEQRYNDPIVNRQYWLADAMIRIRSYRWGLVDVVAATTTDEDVAAVLRIVAALNEANAKE